MALPTTGTCSYYGITFDARTRTKITATPVPDRAGRTVKFVEYTLDVNGWVSDTSSTDDTLESMRIRLTTPGQTLRYTNKGFGDLIVNAGLVRDVEWGPWPKLLEYDPVGNNLSARVHWTCTTRIPECESAKYTTLPLEFSHGVTYVIDGDGYTTINVDGEIVIPMTRKRGGNRTIPDTVDRLREKCFPPVPVRFHRTNQSWNLSLDKRTGHFTYSDVEIPYPLPEGVTRADIRHRLRSSRSQKGGFAIWHGTIGGSLTLARDEAKADGFEKFLLMTAQILAAAKVQVKTQVAQLPMVESPTFKGLQVAVGGTSVGSLFLESVTVDDDVFGRGLSCSVDYRIIGCNIRNFITTSGMFRQQGFDFVKWKEGLAKRGVSGPRGGAGLRHQSGEAIIDLCVGIGHDVNVGNPVIGGAPPKIENPKPHIQAIKPEASWIFFSNRIELNEDDGLALHVPIGEDGAEKPGPEPGGLKALDAGKARATAGKIGTIKPAIQNVRTPIFRCWMIGRAVRLAYDISIPTLQTIGGSPVKEARREVKLGEARNIGDVKIYSVAWRIEYLFEEPPTGPIVQPANPMTRGPGGTGVASVLGVQI